MATYHYVVEYDTDKKRWDWSPNTEHAQFGSKTVYDRNMGWVSYEDESVKPMDEQLNKRLHLGMKFLNYYDERYPDEAISRKN
jgi:hypothetical protein